MHRLVVAFTVLFALVTILPEAEGQRRRRRKRGYGKLVVNSMTKGAEVSVDGKKVGVIPLKKPIKLRAGKHTLKLTKRGYTEFLDVITIRRRKTTSEDIDLLPFAGILLVTSATDEARVFVDGKFIGTTPLEKEILAGEHSVRVRKPGHYEYIRTIKSIAGRVIRLQVALKPMPVGTTPYRPPPPPPPKWYEKWYVWAGAATGVVLVATAIIVPVIVLNKDEVEDFSADHRFSAKGLTFTGP